jgi:alpha-D-xyloside xylohydrolase
MPRPYEGLRLMKLIAMLSGKLLCFNQLLSLAAGFLLGMPLPGNACPGPVRGGTYARTADGVIVYPDPRFSGNASAVKLQVVTDNIIRVLTSPATTALTPNASAAIATAPSEGAPAWQSLITVYSTDPSLHWDIRSEADRVVLVTPVLRATVTVATGAVSFADAAGHEILAEKTDGGHSLEPAVFDGEPSYHIRQTFTLRPGEALYGLGQHQEDQMNYRGRQVRLFQNNTEVAIPFLISNKHYGILWDNYSLTTVGDLRPFRPLSDMQLYSAKGEPGWLTASYSNDRNNPSATAFEKAESSIDYTYLNDTRTKLPPEFKVAAGCITWTGFLGSEFTGVHAFRCSYAGYLKLWIDGKLMLDRWRQAWNPGSALLDLAMEKGRKYPVRVEWIPDGGESYLTLRWQPPLAGPEQDEFSFSSEAGKRLDYYFIFGADMDQVISGYRTLTGKATIVPKWAMGFWQSRERYKTQAEILSTVAEFRKRKIPLDNIVLDWSYWRQDEWGSQEFDATRFPSPDSMIRALHEDYHTHFMISVWPKFYEGIPAYKQFNDKNWLYKRNIADRQRDWIGKGYVSTFYDAFNKDARAAFWKLLDDKLFSKGIDAWWMDASEPDILSNVSPEKRKEQMTPTALGPAAEYLNAYPLENARGIYEGQRTAHPGQRVFLLTRSAFAGSQRYAAAIWSGDIAARWSDLRSQIPAGINYSMSGLPYWTTDIGGFAVEHRFENARGADLEEWREQMTRWYQFGAFCPLFRVHGQYPYREIFNTAPDEHPAFRSMLYYDRLRYRLLPYIYSLAGLAWKKDYTLMRGLAMDFPDDSVAANIGDQYLFGPSLLVNPVTVFGARKRDVYLPSGHGWYDLYSGRFTEGGQWIAADAPYERIPVYVREGSVVPFGPGLQYTDEKPADPITLVVYTGKNGSFDLYEDEGNNYNYEQGGCSMIPITYTQATGELVIGGRKGVFSGMLSQRTFRVIWVTPKKAVALDPDGPADNVVHYKGDKITIKIKNKAS